MLSPTSAGTAIRFLLTSIIFVAGVLSVNVGVFMHVNASASEQQDNQFSEKRAWVDQVNAEDFFFWERFLYRLGFPDEQPMPAEWYRPSELVLGSPGALLPIRNSSERRLEDETVKALVDYVEPRKTGAFYVLHQGQIDFSYSGNGEHAGSLLPIRSITKSIVGLLVGIALSDGDIASLDDPIEAYLPEWEGDERGQITVRQLLHAASGLEAVGLKLDPENKAAQLAEGSDVWAAAFAYEKVEPADTQWAINQVDTQLLGMILERATGQRIATYLSEKIWKPMGLGTATLNLDGKYGRARAFCCMRARALDVLKIGQMVMNGGVWNGTRILPEGWTDAIREPSPANPYFGLHTFLGWGADQQEPEFRLRQTEPYHAQDVFFFLGGLSVYLWMIPSLDLVIFRFGDDPPDWDPSVIANLVIDDIAAQAGGR